MIISLLLMMILTVQQSEKKPQTKLKVKSNPTEMNHFY
jgi:hypothetical protein